MKMAGPRARSNRLSSLLVQNWNSRNGVEIELRRQHLAPPRRAALEARLGTIIRQGSELEAQMTQAAQALMALEAAA